MSAFPRVLSYQNSFLGSKFVVIGVVCCQEMRRNALFHKVLRVLTKYLPETYYTRYTMKSEKWILCPVCRNKTHDKMREDTVLLNFPLYCPKCKQETLISVQQQEVAVIKEPDA